MSSRRRLALLVEKRSLLHWVGKIFRDGRSNEKGMNGLKGTWLMVVYLWSGGGKLLAWLLVVEIICLFHRILVTHYHNKQGQMPEHHLVAHSFLCHVTCSLFGRQTVRMHRSWRCRKYFCIIWSYIFDFLMDS